MIRLSARSIRTLAFLAPKANAPTFTQVFAQRLVETARHDEKIVAITAAMPAGTGSTCSRSISPAAASMWG